MDLSLRPRIFASRRHRTAWLECGLADGPLLIFLHGWPSTAIVWRAQLRRFAAAGWRCVAPDLRGYGGSTVHADPAAYTVRETVADLCELHDGLGGAPAVWVAHDWGSPVAWAIAAHHPERCRGVASLCVPYLARGFALPTLLPLADRARYPEDRYPAAQWDYWLFYREHFAQAAHDFEADVAATLAVLYRRTPREALDAPSPTATVRARGGWFGAAHRAPAIPRDPTMLSDADFDALVAAFAKTGFSGPDAWYLHDDDNLAFAAAAPNGGRLTLPALFVHAARDVVCTTVDGRLAEPMRADCADLTEATIDAGHFVMQERPDDVNDALAGWLTRFEPGT